MKTDEKMRRQAAEIVALLKKARASLAIAESCTGGLLSAAITAIPGASDVFWGGVVAYSLALKNRVLGIDEKEFPGEEVYSPDCARLLAKGVQQLCQSTLAIGITGVAGPTGGSAHYPVGSVSIAIIGLGKEDAETYHFKGSREEIRKLACEQALKIIEALLKEELK